MILSQSEDSADTWCSLSTLPWMCSGTHSHPHTHTQIHGEDVKQCKNVRFILTSDQTPTYSDHPSEISSLSSWTQL